MMVPNMKLSRWLLSLSLVAGMSGAWAGQNCDAAANPSPDVTAQAIKSAHNTVEQLNRSDDTVVLLARMGQDLSEYGLTYSHLAYAVKKDDGQWVVVHKLNECGTAKADIYEQSVTQFYLDDLYKFQAGVWRLSPVIQERLRPQLLGKGSLALHSPNYNMLAYPFGTKYQNSNGWVLEVLAQAIDPGIRSRSQALSWLQRQQFTPSTMKLGVFTRLGARATKANITFEDQPSNERWAGNIQVVTVDSVVNFMRTVDTLCQAPGCAEETVMND